MYGDDIVTFSPSETEYVTDFDALLKRTAETGLRINAVKWQLAKPTVVLRGHNVG